MPQRDACCHLGLSGSTSGLRLVKSRTAGRGRGRRRARARGVSSLLRSECLSDVSGRCNHNASRVLAFFGMICTLSRFLRFLVFPSSVGGLAKSGDRCVLSCPIVGVKGGGYVVRENCCFFFHRTRAGSSLGERHDSSVAPLAVLSAWGKRKVLSPRVCARL